MWILKKIILIDTYTSNGINGKVFSVHKASLEDTALFAGFTNRNTPTFFSKTGVQFLSMKRCSRYPDTHNVLWFRHVSMEHDASRDQRRHDWETEEERRDDYVGDRDCCYSMKVRDVRRRDFVHKYMFSSDGSLVILEEGSHLSAFAVAGFAEGNQRPNSVWRYDYDRRNFSGSLLTNSKFLVLVGKYVEEQGFEIGTNCKTEYTFVDLENGLLVNTTTIVNHDPPEYSCYSHEITKKHLLVFHLGCACPWGQCACGLELDEEREGVLRLVDLDSFQEKRVLVSGSHFDTTAIQHIDKQIPKAIFKCIDGDLAVLLDDDGATLISPTSDDEGELVNPLKTLTGDWAVKFQEVTDGLFVVTTETSVLLYNEDSAAHNSVNLAFQMAFLKGERLSPAIQKWVELFSEPNSSFPSGGFFI